MSLIRLAEISVAAGADIGIAIAWRWQGIVLIIVHELGRLRQADISAGLIDRVVALLAVIIDRPMLLIGFAIMRRIVVWRTVAGAVIMRCTCAKKRAADEQRCKYSELH